MYLQKPHGETSFNTYVASPALQRKAGSRILFPELFGILFPELLLLPWRWKLGKRQTCYSLLFPAHPCDSTEE